MARQVNHLQPRKIAIDSTHISSRTGSAQAEDQHRGRQDDDRCPAAPANIGCVDPVIRFAFRSSIASTEASHSNQRVSATAARFRPRSGDHPAIEVDVAVDDDGEGELLVDPMAGRVAESPCFAGVFEQFQERCDQAAAVGSTTSRPVRPSSMRSVLPAIREATQGRAVAIASRSELLMPSATLGRTKRSAARR